MHYVARPISFRWDEDFIARMDAARGDVPRSRFVRRAVEREMVRPAQYVKNVEAADRLRTRTNSSKAK